MNANGRRCRQFRIKHRHLAKICGKHVKGGRPMYAKNRVLSVADAIAKNRRLAIAEANRKATKKK